jgi:transcriptional regulator with XRE-family HTH domain
MTPPTDTQRGMTEKAISRQEMLFTRLTPLFSPEMGNRLMWARMKARLSQAELGQFLGVSQSVISDIERGKSRVSEFTFSRFKAVMGDRSTAFVMTGAYADAFPCSEIRKTYWDVRQKKRVPSSRTIRRVRAQEMWRKPEKTEDNS